MSAATRRPPSFERVLSACFYALIVPVVLLPLLWVGFGSFKPQSEFFRIPPSFLPAHWSLDAYATILAKTRIPEILANSVFVAGLATLGVLVVASVAAYGFSRWEFPLKGAVLLFLLMCQLIPVTVTITPLYLMLNRFGLLNSHVGLVLVFVATHAPFAIWIMKAQFDSIPQSLDEAAMIDGASRLRILSTILLPVSLPGLGAAAALTFIGIWAEFLVPYVIAGAPETTMISAGIYSLFGMDSTLYFARLFAATILSAAPVIVVYLLAQEQFVAGLTGGSEK